MSASLSNPGQQIVEDPSRADIEAQTDKILASRHFRTSRRRCELLKWAVRRFLDGETEPAKEYTIALEVFGKDESWDSRLDSGIRVEFGRMRHKLRAYYACEGVSDPIIVEFPFRGYLPVFRWNRPSTPDTAPEPDSEASAAVPQPHPRERDGNPHRWRTLSLALAFAAVMAAAIAAAGFFLSRRIPSQPPVTTVAVLPLLDLTPGGGHDYVSDGLTEQLTNELAMVKGLRVIAPASAFQFRGRTGDVRDIGRRLGAGAVLEGSVLRQGDRMRVIVQLNRTADSAHLWGAQYDRDASDLLRIDDEIARAVAGALRVHLAGMPAPEYVPGPKAFDEYLQGFAAEQKSTPASLSVAEMHYNNALRLEPRYAWPHARLASVHILRSGRAGPDQKAELEKARTEAEAAISLDGNLAMPRAQLAVVDYVLKWDWPSAEGSFRRALALGSSATAHQTYGWALMTRGRFSEAEQQLRETRQLDPLNCYARLSLSSLFRMESRLGAAREELRACLTQNPAWFAGRLQLGYLEIFDNRPADGLADLRRAAALAPGTPLLDAGFAFAYATSGRRAEAFDLMRRMESQIETKGYARYSLALLSASLGDRERLFRWLGQSVDFHEQQALNMRIDPAFASFQRDPRMIALERRVGLL